MILTKALVGSIISAVSTKTPWITVSNHFAERVVERKVSLQTLGKFKRILSEKACQFVFDHTLNGAIRRVDVDGKKFVLKFLDERKILIVVTVY